MLGACAGVSGRRLALLPLVLRAGVSGGCEGTIDGAIELAREAAVCDLRTLGVYMSCFDFDDACRMSLRFYNAGNGCEAGEAEVQS